MSILLRWTKLPSAWINDGGLKKFQWRHGQGADNIAALMLLAVIAHHIDVETGVARLTYDQLVDMTSLSRSKVSSGLTILADQELIDRKPDGRSSFKLCNYNPASGWAKFPAKGLYHNDVVAAFTEFRLRRRQELDALKLYYLFVARRDNQTNMAHIGYDKIVEYSGVARNNIKGALTVLGANGLVHIETLNSGQRENSVSNAYRLTNLDTYRHMGTTGRGADSKDIF